MEWTGVLVRLRYDLEDAQERYRTAKERFWEEARRPRRLPGVASGFQNDRSETLRRALAEESYARSQHLKALLRLNKLLIDGIIPHDLNNDAATLKANAGNDG